MTGTRKYTVCIVGLNVGTIFILENLSKIINDILIITSSNIDVKNKIKIFDVVPHIYLKYGDIQRAYLISEKCYKIISSFDTIEVDHLNSVRVRNHDIEITETSNNIRARLVICGDEIIEAPSYGDSSLLRDIIESGHIVLKGRDMFKILELYYLLKDKIDVKIHRNSVESIIEEINPYIHDLPLVNNIDHRSSIDVDLKSERPNSVLSSINLFKVSTNRIVRDFELLLRAFLFLFNGFSRELNIDMMISFSDCLFHIGERTSDVRRRFGNVSVYRSCVDYDPCRVCVRSVCFEDLLLCSDIYCSCFNCLVFVEPILYSRIGYICRFPLPYVFSIYSLYSGFPMYTPEYSYALSIALLRLEKEFK